MTQVLKHQIQFEGKDLILETGELALRAPVAVKATYGETVLLVTITYEEPRDEIDFLDLRIEYQEKYYASGTINSSRFIKREGRPTDDSVISRRVIDHAFRPLFPKDFNLSVQIVVTILSLDDTADAEFLAMVATSAALQSSKLPVIGPVGTLRVGLINDDFVLCPSRHDLHNNSEIEMMVSFVTDEKRFLAVEAGMNIVPEQIVLDSINYARDNIDPILNLIKDYANLVNPNNEKFEIVKKELSQDLQNLLVNEYSQNIKDIVFDTSSNSEPLIKEIKKEAVQKYGDDYNASDILGILSKLEKQSIRNLVLQNNIRIDNRSLDQIRDISCKVDLLPRTHGSGLFTRGNTQSLTIATLGSPANELLQQDMYGERTKRYMHFYNFPAYSTGEIGRFMGPKGREIGHGMIAEKALKPVVPSQSEFPYTIILTSEILSSNGSSSMAATCGSTLALMSAGVPIKDIVGGIAMGLIIDEENHDNYKVLTDLSGEEDFAGFLDFKMTGTKQGVTAIQCDMKVPGISMQILQDVINQSKVARLSVIQSIQNVISAPNVSLSKYAPKLANIKISTDKIGAVIGSGGKTIKQIQEETGTIVHIEDDGNVTVSGIDQEKIDQAIKWIKGLTTEVEVGQIYNGTVVDILDFGALVEILPGKVGLLHISELSNEFVKDIRSVVNVGDTFEVKVLKAEDNGKISLSRKALISNS